MRMIVVSLLLVAVAGCSDGKPRRYPVRGQVKFSDGTPLRRGTVEFQSIGQDPPMTATGSIRPEGMFELETFGGNDGAIAGKHRVVVVGDDEIGTREERPWRIPKSLVHPRHGSFKTSGLEVTVEPKSNTVTIEVDYAPAP